MVRVTHVTEDQFHAYLTNDHVLCITRYRSTAGDLLKSARQRALLLHVKHTNCDGYPNGRA